MPIYAYSPELALEFRRQHRRQVVRTRAIRRRQQAEKPKEIRDKQAEREFERAIERDRDK